MDVFFDCIKLLGGLALFLYGMNVMGSGLERASGSALERILEKLTNNIFKSVLLGAVITAAVQSSSATTVIVVGFVNAGVMKLRQAVGVIMGANIGTTITSQILRLGDIDSDTFILQFLKPDNLAYVLALVGIIMFMLAKKDRTKEFGQIFLGFGVLFVGMNLMSGAVKGYADSEIFKVLFSTLTNPVLGVIVGALVTAIIQSSSASVGILQALSKTGAITYASAIPIIIGQNIGTCITPILSSIGANKNAKRSAMIHLYFNVIGCVIFLAGIYLIQFIIGFPFWNDAIDMGGIANFHTLFNLIVTACLIPFSGLLCKLAEITIKNKGEQKEEDEGSDLLDDRFLVTPSIAIAQTRKTVYKMLDFVRVNYKEASGLVEKFDSKVATRVLEQEDVIDKLEDRLGNYLVKITDRDLSDEESHEVTQLLQLINEFERIGDYATNLTEKRMDMYERDVHFSDFAKKELHILSSAVSEVLEITFDAYENMDIEKAYAVEPLEETIDVLERQLRIRHIERLKSGDCTLESGIKFLDLLSDFERVSDHCSNIAIAIIGNEDRKTEFDPHAYIKDVHEGKEEKYAERFEEFKAKYITNGIDKL